MNPGLLALLTLLGTVGAAIAVVWYRDLIFDTEPTRPPARRPSPRRPSPRQPRQVQPSETSPKPAAMISVDVSSVATPNTDAEMIAAETIARLVAAKLVTETRAIETVFNVRAGKGKDYTRVHAKFKTAQAAIESSAAAGGS